MQAQLTAGLAAVRHIALKALNDSHLLTSRNNEAGKLTHTVPAMSSSHTCSTPKPLLSSIVIQVLVKTYHLTQYAMPRPTC